MIKTFILEFTQDLAMLSKALLLAVTVIVSMIALVMWTQWLLLFVLSVQIVALFVIASFILTIAAIASIEDIKSETLTRISFRTLTMVSILSTLLIYIFQS